MKTENVEDRYPCFPTQQAFLFNSLYAPGSGVDIIQVICTLREELEVGAFERAWQRVVDRHSILRTGLCWEDLPEPVLQVFNQLQFEVRQEDWRGLAPQVCQARLEDYLLAERKLGFDLTKPPLIHAALFRIGQADYRFVFTFHHIVLDGRSLRIVLREGFEFYAAFRQGRELELAPAPLYRDYIAWLNRQDLSGDESFWRTLLKGFTSPTLLAAARQAESSTQNIAGYAEQDLWLSEEATTTLRDLARRRQLTLNTFVQAAWAWLLSRYSGQEDVVFGAVRSCRHATVQDADALVGLSINTLPARARVSPRMPLMTLLQELRAQSVAMRDHLFTPLAQVQRWSEIPHGTVLFDHIILFENFLLHNNLRSQGGDWLKREFQLRRQPEYPLAVYVFAEPQLLLKMVYDRQYFDHPGMARILDHFRNILEGMTAHPDGLVGDCALMSEQERRQVLIEWNVTHADYFRQTCLHELFQAQAERTPDAAAVVFENATLTYQEVDRRANQLAHHLHRREVGIETPVGICMERSAEMVIGVLGILKVGGAYVPLDPSHPPDRLAYILEDSGAQVVLTQELVFEGLELNGEAVYMDAAWESIGQESITAPESSAEAQGLAYIIYTSGSTGKPKGVQVQHRGVINFLEAMRREPGLEAEDRLLAVTTLSFDIAGLELLLPLTVGGCVVLVGHEVAMDGLELGRRLEASGATVMQATPATWRLLLESGWTGKATLRILCGGEAMPRDLANQLVERTAAVWNMYGPTETTIWSCIYRVTSGEGAVPIGRPIANTRVYVLDGEGQPAPIGVVGELHIGGDGVARGYWRRPELTAERFVPDPFSNQAGTRLYRTGDLARYLATGEIEFLGRSDQQVKIRGFRIEPGEIEMALKEHPLIRAALVMAREDTPGEKRLVGYVIPSQPVSVHDLREYLGRKLPEYMLPASFVMLTAFPLTPNGKIDRRALPAPERSVATGEKSVAPRTPTEQAVLQIWEQILGLEHLGVYDHFFELGGHSLMATRVMARVRRLFNVELPLRTLFEAPTVAGLAQLIDRAGLAGATGTPAAISLADYADTELEEEML